MKADQIQRVTVVGGGLMGHGIAQDFALAGYEVTLNTRSEESAARALENVRGNLERLAGLGAVTEEEARSVPAAIQTNISLEEAVSESDLVIEAVAEDLELKREIFARLDRSAPAGAILASTTSSFLPSQYAIDTKRPERVVGAHYFNPPYLLPLVEIIRGERTSEDVVEVLYELLQSMGKKPVLVRKEALGFIGNRLQAALLREALSIVQKGIATVQDVDTVIRTSIGRRWAVAGLFETFDLAGWDVVLSAATAIGADLDPPGPVPPLLEEKVAAGELGVKTGKGFYDWTPEKVAELQERITAALLNG